MTDYNIKIKQWLAEYKNDTSTGQMAVTAVLHFKNSAN